MGHKIESISKDRKKINQLGIKRTQRMRKPREKGLRIGAIRGDRGNGYEGKDKDTTLTKFLSAAIARRSFRDQ